MLRVIRGVAALLVWIVAGEMREQEGTQQIKFKAAEMRVHVMWDTPEPPPLLNHHAHCAAMECAPNFFGTWTVEKPFKRETGTVLKWSWQRVVGFLLVTLCFSCSMWAIICNVSDPHEFYSWGCLKKAGTHTHTRTHIQTWGRNSSCRWVFVYHLFATAEGRSQRAGQLRWSRACCQSHWTTPERLKCFSVTDGCSGGEMCSRKPAQMFYFGAAVASFLFVSYFRHIKYSFGWFMWHNQHSSSRRLRRQSVIPLHSSPHTNSNVTASWQLIKTTLAAF